MKFPATQLLEKFSFLLLMPLVFPCKKDGGIDVPFNRSPVASAGYDRTVILPENSTRLNGTNSYDPDSRDWINSYKWTKVSGPENYNIDNPAADIATITDLVQGKYVFELEVKDRLGSAAKDSVSIDVVLVEYPPWLLFENLPWVIDSVNNVEYMQTPPIIGKHSVDDIISVSIHKYDFDYFAYVWKTIERDGTEKNTFYYKVQDNTVVVYMYYTLPRTKVEYLVERKIKVTFSR